MSTLRRIHDAKVSNKWMLFTSVSFVLITVVISLIDESNRSISYWLLVIPALSNFYFLTYPEKTQHIYILGYFGPIDLTTLKQETINHSQRIEPTLLTKAAEHSEQAFAEYELEHQTETNIPEPNVATVNAASGYSNSSNKVNNKVNSFDFGEKVRLFFFNNKANQQKILIVFIVLTLLIITAVVMSVNSTTPLVEGTIEQAEQVKTVPTHSRLYPLTMPDNFTLYQSSYEGIVIHWQADTVNESKVWSQETAQGDESCQVIRFNQKLAIRTLAVQVENKSDYYATFSPLDSKQLIQAIAFKNNFSLCGYKFSLKGSQATLATNEHYAKIVDYR